MASTSTLPREGHIEVPCRDTFLPGILTFAHPDTRTPEIALMLHGQMAHKNQTCVVYQPLRSPADAGLFRYHRPLAKALAQQVKIDSFRFDFAHAKYNQPGWDWHMSRISRDVDELQLVVDFLREKYGYKVKLREGRRICSFRMLNHCSRSHRPLEGRAVLVRMARTDVRCSPSLRQHERAIRYAKGEE